MRNKERECFDLKTTSFLLLLPPPPSFESDENSICDVAINHRVTHPLYNFLPIETFENPNKSVTLTL